MYTVLWFCSWVLTAASSPVVDPVPTPPAVVQPTGDLFELLRSRIRDRSPATRRAAVREAAGLGTRAAWDLVVGALADAESEVADEAQLRLGDLTDEHVLRDLLLAHGLRSTEDGVRERVAEALGRMRLDLDADALARRLSTRPADLEFTSMLLWSIERQARAGRLEGGVERTARTLRSILGSRRDPRLRGEALLALVALGPDRVDALVEEALASREPVLRCAGLSCLGNALPEDSVPRAVELSHDPDPRVRVAALERLDAAVAMGDRGAVLALVERLETEPARRVRWRALELLRGRSGLKHRLDPRPWRVWAEGLREDWSPPTPPTTTRRQVSRARSLAGFPLHSQRVAFLFDFSGSMWTPLADGRMPKDVVEVELRRTLESLDDQTHFNLIPFTDEVLPWRSSVVPAEPRNVRAALEYFERCNERGRGNFLDAALLALDDPAVDTLVVLTDGVPTGGTHSDLELVAALFEHRNRLRRVALDVLLVDARPGTREVWQRLARSSGGTAIEVRLDAP